MLFFENESDVGNGMELLIMKIRIIYLLVFSYNLNRLSSHI